MFINHSIHFARFFTRLRIPLILSVAILTAVSGSLFSTSALAESTYSLVVETAWNEPAGAGALSPRLRSLADSLGARTRRLSPSSPAQLSVWEFPTEAARRQALERLRAQSGIRHAEIPGRRFLADVTPNDPLFSTQWALSNTGQSVSGQAGTAGADIGAPQFWSHGTGGSAIIVAVIDTGIDATHPDLAGNLWTNPGEIAGNGIDDDHNGYVDDIHGWGAYNNSADISDTLGHGTIVSGVIGASGNNGVGVCGINWRVSLMTLNAFGPTNDGKDEAMVAAIDYAIANGAKVINASWGGPDWADILYDAVERARAAGIIICAAAGNSHHRMDMNPFYPAAIRLPNILSVGSSDNQDHPSYFSNRGGMWIDLFAPGASIQTTAKGGGYSYASGTSLSAPMASGAAALLYQQSPGLDPFLAARRLRGAAQKTTSLEGQAQSPGRLWLPNLITSDSTAPAAITDLRIVRLASNGATLAWTAPGNDGATGTALVYDFRYSSTTLSEASFHRGTQPPWLPAPAAAGTTQYLHLTGIESNYPVWASLRTQDSAGNLSAPSNSLSFTTLDSSVIFEEDFEDGASGWTFQTPWSIQSDKSHSGDSCVSNHAASSPAAGTYDIISPSFSLVGKIRPVLTFYEYRSFEDDYSNSNSPSTPRIYGQVDVSTNDGASWEQAAVYSSAHEPFHREPVSLARWAGASSIRLRWRFTATASSIEYYDWSLDDIRVEEPAEWLPEASTLLVEPYAEQGQFPNDSLAFYEQAASGADWERGVQREQIARVLSPWARERDLTNLSGASARYAPRFQSAGLYEVFVSWPRHANAKSVRYIINHLYGETAISLDQNGPANGAQWRSLGSYLFAEGRDTQHGAVTLDASAIQGTATPALSGRLCADSVRFDFISYEIPTRASRVWLGAHSE